MWTVSKATGVRLNLLMAANPQVRDPNELTPGSVLSIPELGKEATAGPAGDTTAGSPAAAVHPPVPVGRTETTGAAPGAPGAPGSGQPGGPAGAASGGVTGPETVPYFGFVWPHVVKRGETWERIARLYHVPVDTLKRMNTGHTEPLQPGDIVYVPGTAGQVPGLPGQSGGWQPEAAGHAAAGQPAGPIPAPLPQAAADTGGTPVSPNGYGPHTHVPYRPYHPQPMYFAPYGARGPWGYAPYGFGPGAYPAYPPAGYPAGYPGACPGGFPGGAPGGYAAVYPPHGVWQQSPGAGLPPEAGYRMWAASQYAPTAWMTDWDESSSESDWSSTFSVSRQDGSDGEPPYGPESP